MALPLKTTSDDVREIVRYLKTKATGATVSEAKAAGAKKAVDPRKLAAYTTWGIVARDDNRLKLTDRGWLIAREPGREAEAFRQVLDANRAYRSILEWANHQEMTSVTTVDVAVHLHEHHRDVVGDANDNTLRENAVCFFNVAEAAGFGTLMLGRGGKQTRLDVNLEVLKAHIEAGPSTPPWEGEDTVDEGGDVEDELGADDDAGVGSERTNGGQPADDGPLRVFISHGKNHDIVEQIETLLEMADITSEIAENEETPAIPVPDKVLDAMRRCQAGIIAVTVEEGRKDDEGNYVLNDNVLIEIGAAFVLYERKVVLVWDKRLKVPSNLQGLYRCEFEGDALSWPAGMKLMKAIKGFKKQPATT